GEVSERYPTTARSTVSKTLDLLKEMGEIRELSLQDGTVRICSRGDPHVHLICTRCGGVHDLHGQKITAFERAIIRESGYLVTDSDIKFYGLCEPCR
ncbi:MAG: Fur family transcriptional regulator, partial [Candidatus Geothermarchaeales archaeon]